VALKFPRKKESDFEEFPSYLVQDKGIIPVPMDLYNDFLLNSSKAMRDFASIPTEAISQFYGDIGSKISDVFTSAQNNLLDSTEFKLRNFKRDEEEDTFRRYMHIDIGLKKDAVGISMCHVPKYVELERFDEESKKYTMLRFPYIKFDFAGRVLAPRNGEIELSRLRDIIEMLRDVYGYDIALITFDRYQSADSLQILRNLGFTVGHLSIDRTANVLKVNYDKKDFIEKITTDKNYATPHEMFKVAIGDGRVEIPRVFPGTEKVSELDREWSEEREIKSQEYDSVSNKVTKSFHGTDDWIQSVVGALCNAVTNELDFFGRENKTAVLEDDFDPYTSSPEDDPYENYNLGGNHGEKRERE